MSLVILFPCFDAMQSFLWVADTSINAIKRKLKQGMQGKMLVLLKVDTYTPTNITDSNNISINYAHMMHFKCIYSGRCPSYILWMHCCSYWISKGGVLDQNKNICCTGHVCHILLHQPKGSPRRYFDILLPITSLLRYFLYLGIFRCLQYTSHIL